MNKYVSNELRRLVTERASSRCEYCLFPQRFFGTSFHIEHIIASKHSGQTISENLALACSTCNEFKGTDVGSYDFESDGALVPFFNPRTQIWTEHFQIETDGETIPLTAQARVTARILRFNDEARIEERRELIEAELY